VKATLRKLANLTRFIQLNTQCNRALKTTDFFTCFAMVMTPIWEQMHKTKCSKPQFQFISIS